MAGPRFATSGRTRATARGGDDRQVSESRARGAELEVNDGLSARGCPRTILITRDAPGSCRGIAR